MKKTLSFFIIILFCATSPLLAIGTDEIESYIKKTMEMWNVPGLAIGIVKDNRIILLKGYGVRKMGNPEKIDVNTIFRIASVSKTFASVLVATFVEDGSIQWDEKIYPYLPKLNLKKTSTIRTLTMTHILSHSTGFPRHTYTHLLDKGISYKNILKKLDSVKPIYKPGKGHSYQNIVFSLSGYICENIAGKSYEALLKERLFQPLKMTNASCSFKAFKSSKNKAMPHKKMNNICEPLDYNTRYYDVGPAAGINASVLDMTKWIQEFLSETPTILTKKSILHITTPIIHTPKEITRWNASWCMTRVKRADYGLGWRVFDYSGAIMIYHAGLVEGYAASLAILPKQKIGIVVLTNVGSPFISNIIMSRFIDSVLELKSIGTSYTNHRK